MQRIVGAAASDTEAFAILLNGAEPGTRIIQPFRWREIETEARGRYAAPRPLRCAARPQFPRNENRGDAAILFARALRAARGHLPRRAWILPCRCRARCAAALSSARAMRSSQSSADPTIRTAKAQPAFRRFSGSAGRGRALEVRRVTIRLCRCAPVRRACG